MADYRTQSCRDWNLNVLDYLEQTPPNFVVTLANTRGDEDSEGIAAAIRAVVEMGVKVIAFRDTPDMQDDVSVCQTQLQFTGTDCRVPRDDLLDDEKYKATIAALPASVIAVDINDNICSDNYCNVVSDGKMIWRDSHHLTASFASTLADEIWLEIGPNVSVAR